MKRKTKMRTAVVMGTVGLLAAGLALWAAAHLGRAAAVARVGATQSEADEPAKSAIWSTLRAAGATLSGAGSESSTARARMKAASAAAARVGIGRDELTALTAELGLSEAQKTKARTIMDVVQRSEEMIVLQQDEARKQRALQRLEARARRALGAIVSGEQQALLDRHFAARDRETAP